MIPKPELTFVFPWDNSNSQYGLLGVWAGAEVGAEVPDAYWGLVDRHWKACQLPGGQWAYNAQDRQGYYAMTCAGIASLLVTHDYLDGPMLHGAVGRPPYSDALAAGLAWLENAANSVAIPNEHTHYMGYDLFGLERVGLASGYKYFGGHDWYRELAARIVASQFPNGAWGHDDHGNDTVVDTAYTLLFLSRGRHPIIMTKLKFDPAWNNRPRDVANLARFASRDLERPLNWQVVGIEHPWYDWFDSPVLYIASHRPPALNVDGYRNLRDFALAGGLIFTHADAGSKGFDKWVGDACQKLFPGYPLRQIAPNDPIFSLQYKLGAHEKLMGVSNGARWLLVHSPGDLAATWQQRSDKTRRDRFQLGTNIFLYAAGKPELRNRIDSSYVPAPATPAARRITVARLKYDGNWDPEPGAWQRFSRVLQSQSGQAIDLKPMAIEKLIAGAAPLATLTGTDAHQFTDAESKAMRAYVESGGVLLIDSCGGENAFTGAVRDQLLEKTFADALRQPLPSDHALYKDLSPGKSNPSPLRLRGFAIEHLGQLAPQVQIFKLGSGYVAFSSLDLTSGLLGTNTWGIMGYEPNSAQTFVRNLVFWADGLQKR